VAEAGTALLSDDGLEAGVGAGMVVVAVLVDSKDSVEEST